MLILDHVDTVSLGKSSLEIDEYVPIAAEVFHQDDAPTLYWRAKPNAKTLVEVGLSSESGRLRSVTLPSIDGAMIIEDKACREVPKQYEGNGVPCFDLAGWQASDDFDARFLDVEVGVRLIVSAGSCSVEFGESSALVTNLQFGDMRCVFDDRKALVRIDFLGLDCADADTLRGLICSD